MLDKKVLTSIVYLGWEFFLHLLRKYVLRRKSPGLEEFIEYYREDRIVSLTAEERDRHPAYSRCIACGLCDPVCPVLNAVGSTRFAGPADVACSLSRDLTESGAWPDPFLSTLCGACDRICPEQVPVVEMITYLRRKSRLTVPENLPAFYREAIVNLEGGNGVFGKVAPSDRPDAAQLLYWRGCRQAVWETDITRKLLEELGVDFMTVEEDCCGGLPVEMGLDYDAAPVLERIRASGASGIVTACPICAATLRGALPEMSVKLAADLIYETGPPPGKLLEGAKVVFHDPCRMGRGPDVWEPPRDIIRNMGGELVGLEREKDTASCCGAGGGLLEVEPDVARKVARDRIDEIVATGANILVTTCELCARHLAENAQDIEKLRVYTLEELFLSGKTS